MAAQLSTIRYREDSRGLTEIESKDQGNSTSARWADIRLPDLSASGYTMGKWIKSISTKLRK
jgi:hypothetical protein